MPRLRDCTTRYARTSSRPTRPDGHTASRLVPALLLPLAASLLTACPPRIPKGTALVERIAEPAPVERVVEPSAEVARVEILHLAGGSRFDPPGHEGRAFLAHHALPVHDRLWVRVGRDHAWWTVLCDAELQQSPERCLEPIRAALTELPDPQGARSVARSRLTAPDAALATTEVLYGLLYEAHPYGHPIAGRLGVLGPEGGLPHTDVPQLRATTRARVVASTPERAEALAAALEPILAALPTEVPPDAAMKGPPPASGPVLATLPAPGPDVSVHLGIVLPRRATRTTRLLPDAQAVTTFADASACLHDAVPGLAWAPPPEGPPGWDPALVTPNHPALIWHARLSTDEADEVLASLPDAVAALPDALTSTCAADPEASASAVRSAVEGGYTVVTTLPSDVEDPWTPRVQGAETLDLPAPADGLFR